MGHLVEVKAISMHTNDTLCHSMGEKKTTTDTPDHVE